VYPRPDMGRIGSGEMMTLAFGLGGPLLYLGVGVLLVMWGRHQARVGRGRPAQVGWISALLAVFAALLGTLSTATLLAGAFEGAAAAPPESRAIHVADGISGAMNALALGMGLSLTLYLVSLTANLIAARTPQTTPPPP